MAAIDGLGSLLRLRTFSLRTGLVLFILLGVAFGFVGRWIQSVRDRGEAQLWLVSKANNDGPVASGVEYGRRLFAYYESEANPSRFTTVIRKWVHPEYNRKLNMLSLGGLHTDAEHLQRVGKLFGVEHLILRGDVDAGSLHYVFATPGLKKLNLDCKINNTAGIKDWSAVINAKQLEWIEIGEERLIEDGLIQEIVQLPTIKKIRMSCEKKENLKTLCECPTATEALLVGSERKWVFSDFNRSSKRSPAYFASKAPGIEVFDELAKRNSLDRLLFLYLDFKDPLAIRKFCETSNVTFVYGTHIHISAECLAEFAKLKRLKSLNLGYDAVTAENAQILKTMTKLKELKIGRKTSPQIFEELQNALPNCTIGKV